MFVLRHQVGQSMLKWRLKLYAENSKLKEPQNFLSLDPLFLSLRFFCHGEEKEGKSGLEEEESVMETCKDVRDSGSLIVGGQKTRSKGNVGQIPPLELYFDQEMERSLLTPEQSLDELITRSREKSKLSEWMTIMQHKEIGILGSKNRASVNSIQVTPKPPEIDKNDDIVQLNPIALQLTIDDIAEELDYWKSGVVAFTISANPHVKTFEGFCIRIWGKLNIDKVIPLKKGVFLIRFLNVETRDKALASLHVMMDKKPVCLKQWESGMELSVNDARIPVWVQLPSLPLKYWGKKCLEKIVGLIGTPIRPDSATQARDRVDYVKYLVEMDINQSFADIISFLDEKGMVFYQKVNWEWKPHWCSECGELGHADGKCQKHNTKMVWRPKAVQKGN
ncbi:uncharacterized protein LOC110691008 [Chenopodium quinoa]|uniref:uncharacterized protein LOC110691008 n=1 Tax=Chenopodium quinoa TaxID=63459 RepID=UPI000B792844|nr:uncharacterized protein LOC110691008 [Chenopodium quinoa]